MYKRGTYTDLINLDKVLHVLERFTRTEMAGGVPLQKQTVEQLIRFLKSDVDISVSEIYIQLILKKLIKDGYVDSLVENGNEVYFITFDGSVFIQSGGYSQEQDLAKKQLTILEESNEQQRRNSKTMTTLTKVIAIGTAIAAIYYLIEILKNFYPNVCRH